VYVTFRKQLATDLVTLIRTAKNEKEIRMKYMLVALLSLMFASTAFADNSVVRWKSVVGVITAQNVDNPVSLLRATRFRLSCRRHPQRDIRLDHDQRPGGREPQERSDGV
jgi:hypothetical protein